MDREFIIEDLKYQLSEQAIEIKDLTMTNLILEDNQKCLEKYIKELKTGLPLQEKYYNLLIVNKFKNSINIIDTITLPCWKTTPEKFAVDFESVLQIYHSEISSWYDIYKIIILSENYEYQGRINQRYINKEITFQYLEEMYYKIKDKKNV